MTVAAAPRPMANPGLAQTIREQLLLDKPLIVATANQVIAGMPAHRSELFKRKLLGKPFQTSIMRAVVNIGVVLTMVKVIEDTQVFMETCSIIHDVPMHAHDGLVGEFAMAMVELDIQELADVQRAQAAQAPAAAETGDAASVLQKNIVYDLASFETQSQRLHVVKTFLVANRKA